MLAIRHVCRQIQKHTDEVSCKSLSAKSCQKPAKLTSQTLVVRPPHIEVTTGTVGVGSVALTIGPVAVEGFCSATDQ